MVTEALRDGNPLARGGTQQHHARGEEGERLSVPRDERRDELAMDGQETRHHFGERNGLGNGGNMQQQPVFAIVRVALMLIGAGSLCERLSALTAPPSIWWGALTLASSVCLYLALPLAAGWLVLTRRVRGGGYAPK